MAFTVKTRWGASGIHLVLSALIAAGVLAFMLAAWYPGPLFQAAGGNDLLLILVGVDVVIGPLITLVIYRPGKRGLKFDLAAIGVLQLAALAYGAHIVYLARPAFIVFVKDRFEVVTAVELAPEALAEARFPQFRAPSLAGPRLAASDFPTDPGEKKRLLELAFAGFDLQHFPKYWVPYEERRKELLAAAQTLEQVRKSEPVHAKVVEEYLAQSGTRPEDVRWLLLRARRAFVSVVIDPKTAEPLKMLVAEKI